MDPLAPFRAESILDMVAEDDGAFMRAISIAMGEMRRGYDGKPLEGVAIREVAYEMTNNVLHESAQLQFD